MATLSGSEVLSPEGDTKIVSSVSTFMLNASTLRLSDSLSLVVQNMLESAIQQINHCPAVKHWENQLSYLVTKDLTNG